jgi:hypothetical protein
MGCAVLESGVDVPCGDRFDPSALRGAQHRDLGQPARAGAGTRDVQDNLS